MRKIIYLSLFFFVCTLTAVGQQKFVYVDSKYILDQIPEYQEAQKKLDAIADEWRKEIDIRQKQVEDLYKSFQAEQVLLTDDMKAKKVKEIEDKEKSLREYQKAKFGYEGELFLKRQELVKPIQDKIYNEIQKLATAKLYDIVFDKSSGLTMLYSNPKLDKSQDILDALGVKPATGGTSTTSGTSPSSTNK